MRTVAWAVVVLLLLVGSLQAADPAVPASPAGSGMNESDVLAYVNGQPIPMKDIYELLLRSHGLEMAQQLVASELVNQAAAKQGVTVSDAETAAESEATVQRMFPDVKEPSQRMKLLEQLLERRNVTSQQWMLAMRRNVVQRKLAEPTVQVTEEDLRAEFAERYGRKVVVRIIETASAEEMQRVVTELGNGASFVAMVRKYSKNPSAAMGGMLPPIGKKAMGLPPALRDAALALDKPDELSKPIQVSTAFYLMKLEKVMEPTAARYEDVREKMSAEVREQKLAAAQQRILLELIRDARVNNRVQYVNPIIKRQADSDTTVVAPAGTGEPPAGPGANTGGRTK